MSKRLNISAGAKWEDIVGYSRAVKVGNLIEVAGTTAVDENGNVVGPGDPYAQTKFILSKIDKALRQAGATFTPSREDGIVGPITASALDILWPTV